MSIDNTMPIEKILENASPAPSPVLNTSLTAINRDIVKDFSTIRQGTATNALTKLNAIVGKTATIDTVSGTATITKGDITLTIPNYQQLVEEKRGVKTSTYQLLDAITVALTESGAKSHTVVLSLSQYMEKRGIKDRKEAKNQVKADLEILRTASITGEEKRGKNTESYSFVNIADSGDIKRNGDIVFTFGTTFFNMLVGYPVMPYPIQLQQLNSKRNPNSYYLLRKIAEHKNMNVGKPNENTISVKTLLNVCPFIPTYDEVMQSSRALSRQIIEPFERDMNALENTLEWHYCHSNSEPLTDEELEALNYDMFKDLLIFTEWNNYPDQTARLEKKAERIKGSKNTRKKNKS